MEVYHYILAVLFVLLALLLIGVILLQRGRGVGLAGAFGGAGGHTAFGSKTGDVLTWATVFLASLFLFYGGCLNHFFVGKRAEPTRIEQLNSAADAAATEGAAQPAEGTDQP